MDPINVHVFDPGGTTGFAQFTFTSDDDGKRSMELVRTAEFSSIKHIQQWSQRWSGDSGVVLIEKFRLRANAAEHLINNDMIACVARGHIEAFAYLCNFPVIYQSPSSMANMSLPFIMEQLRLTELPSGEHRKDAIKHGVCYFFSKKWLKIPEFTNAH